MERCGCSFAPSGLFDLPCLTHGLRRGLCSVAASRLLMMWVWSWRRSEMPAAVPTYLPSKMSLTDVARDGFGRPADPTCTRFLSWTDFAAGRYAGLRLSWHTISGWDNCRTSVDEECRPSRRDPSWPD